MNLLAALQWHPRLEPAWCGLLVLGMSLWLGLVWRRLKTRLPAGKVRWLLLPKLAVALLVLVALFDPVSALPTRRRDQAKVLVLLDSSSSMDVLDDPRGSRLERVRQILEKWKLALPRDVAMDALEFDTQVHAARATPERAGLRGTDLGGCLLALSERPDISAYRAVALLTDGGDEAIDNLPLPAAPLSIVGMGSDPATWNDVSISELQAPTTAEKGVQFEIAADLHAHARPGDSFSQQLAQVKVRLEQQVSNAWHQIKVQSVNLSDQRARAQFLVSEPLVGLHRYRVSTESLPGELSPLNNTRELSVDVQKRSVHVLYFTRELGQSFKTLRNELARDPGLAFTALFRVAGERFTVQGDRPSGGGDLEAGLPSSLQGLQPYDVILFGSCPASDCSPAQMQALTDYVDRGGVAIFLGGNESFGRGGYASTPWASLFPWRIRDQEPEPSRGTFNVLIPPAAAGHPIIAGMDEALVRAGASVESLNQVGDLKPGATSLLVARSGFQALPVVAVQPFGRGKVLAVASDTLWKWATKPEPLRSAYGTFWRQAVRNLTGQTEGGPNLAIKWDRPFYRPGEQAAGTIRVLGVPDAESLHFSATLTAGAEVAPLTVERAADQTNAFRINLRFRQRGEYGLRLVAYRADRVLESYEKTFAVAPLAAEGSRLELNATFLKSLAERGGGLFLRENEADQFVQKIQAGMSQNTVVVESSLVEAGPWFFLAVLLTLLWEWSLRRYMNLI